MAQPAAKRLVLISGSEASRRTLAAQMEDILGPGVALESYAFDQGITRTFSHAVVLLASPLIRKGCEGLLDATCTTIVASRTLNFSNLDQLCAMPQNSSLLIVNGSQQTTAAVISQLQAIGFERFNYYPYFPGSTLDDVSFDFVLTPGETRLVPIRHARVIDLGPRIFDIPTILEVVRALDALDARTQAKIHAISSEYMRKIISLGQELHVKHDNLKLLNEFLFKIINSVNDGILVYGKDGTVELLNDIAAKILNLQHRSNILGESRSNARLHDFLRKDLPENQIIRIGHSDYMVSKIFKASTESCLLTLKDIREHINMENQLKKEQKKQGYRAKYAFSDIIHASASMKTLIAKGRKLAESEFNILIYGESGTGKELFAGAMHNASKRRSGPYFAVNCSALPDELIESELFGYEEGAFTGAKRGGKTGLFELANHGTLFLDEIGDISPRIQSRLLRILQEKEVLKVGGTKNIPVDVRVVAATNKDLAALVARGVFREDLYYRLNKLYVHIPPLRERREDIDPLFRHFILQKHGSPIKVMEDARSIILNHDWPGNVRELENNVEYILAVRENPWIDRACLSDKLLERATVDHAPEEALATCLLELIAQENRKHCSIGRERLLALARAARPGLSEPQVRKVLAWLSGKGWLRISQGRVGLQLTTAGAARAVPPGY